MPKETEKVQLALGLLYTVTGWLHLASECFQFAVSGLLYLRHGITYGESTKLEEQELRAVELGERWEIRQIDGFLSLVWGKIG